MKISFELWFDSYLGNTGVWYKSIESNTGSPIFELYLVCFGCCFSDRCCSTASKSTEVSSLLLDPTIATAGFTASLQVFSFSAEAPTSIVNANQGRQKSSCLYILSLSLSAVKGNAFSQLISCSPTCNVQQSFSFVASGENAIYVESNCGNTPLGSIIENEVQFVTHITSSIWLPFLVL